MKMPLIKEYYSNNIPKGYRILSNDEVVLKTDVALRVKRFQFGKNIEFWSPTHISIGRKFKNVRHRVIIIRAI